MPFAPVQKHPRYRVSVPVSVITHSGDLEELPLEDVSLGGVFIKTSRPWPRGSFVRLRFPVDDNAPPLGLMGRVVHVIDEETSAQKSRAPGMGVQFDGLSPDTEAMLRRFVGKLVEAERRLRERQDAAHFVDVGRVEVAVERTALARLWADGLDHGSLCASGEARLGNRVSVVIGPCKVFADVVHVDVGAGARLLLLDWHGAKREAVKRFVEGTAQELAIDAVTAIGPPLGKVLAEARRLFHGIASGDGFSAMGLAATASADDVNVRARELLAGFSAAHEDASRPQRARLTEAVRALTGLAASLLEREAVAVHIKDQVSELVAEATFFQAEGEREEARAALLAALELAPDDDDVKRHLAVISAAADNARAVELMKDAEHFMQIIGMRDAALAHAREAAGLSREHEVRVRVLRFFAVVDAYADAVALAATLCDVSDAGDDRALAILFTLHEAKGSFAAAARAGEALLGLHPDDAALRSRVERVVQRARCSP